MNEPRVSQAINDTVVDEDGNRYIDLYSGYGVAWLGHGNRHVTERLEAQLRSGWVCSSLPSAACAEASGMVQRCLPETHRLATLYSTGMEAAEFALRVARVHTGRQGVIGFENSMHGKSMATAFLGWDNKDGVLLTDFHRLPFVPNCGEDEILRELEARLKQRSISAVFVEPLQGVGGGYMASKQYYQEVARLCRKTGTLLLFDEILTGFHRTGNMFFFSDLGFVPDIVLVGKGMGNGFPVSGVILDRKIPIQKPMFMGSTFSGNALACTAVAATLQQMDMLNLPQKVSKIEHTVRSVLGALKPFGTLLRGKGAMWVLELPPHLNAQDIGTSMLLRGVLVSCTEREIRILPAATIEPLNLEQACRAIREEITKRADGAEELPRH